MWLKRFIQDKRGSIAPVVAGVLLPVLSLIGAGVDYTRANSVKASLQSALDSTALAMSKNAGTLNAEQFLASAQTYFAAMFNRPDANNVQINATYTDVGGSKVVVTASAEVNTTFLNLAGIGIPKIEVGAAATSTWSNKRLRVALALDNTGSMAQSGKLAALKTASHNLLAQLQAVAAHPGDVYVSIIPFGKDVDVGTGNVAATWIDWTYWDAANGNCSKSSYHSQSTCASHAGVWTPANHNTWNGCVMDRDQNNDTTNVAPVAGSSSTKFPAEQYGGCPAALIALTDDWSALNARVDQMIATGNTNQTIGLQWGWQSLSQVAPLNAPAKDPNYLYQDVIILLTDGLNTENRWSQSQGPVDQRTQKACNNVKAAGVTVYTVLVMAGNASLLQECASDATKYFALTNANQIITAFQTIGTNLAQLHLAK